MRWRVAGALAAWTAGLLLAGLVLRHPAPLRLEVGAGDDALADGFREGWDRFEVRGRNTFRWTREEARLTFPAVVYGDAPTLVVRCGRFAGPVVPVTLSLNDRVLAQWSQGTSGWRLARHAAPVVRGETLKVTFSSSPSASPAEPSGLAVDWLVAQDIDLILPRARGWVGLALLTLLVPGLLVVVLRTWWPLAAVGPLVLSAFALVASTDPAGALTTLELAGPRATAAAGLLVLVSALLRRAWAAARAFDRNWVLVPVLAALAAVTLLSYPRFHYPDVETHGRFLAGIRATPSWALDPREYQGQTRAWTRSIGGQLVGFPYSAAFHVVAWPLAPLFGEVGALKTLAATAVGLSALWLYALARSVSDAPGLALLSQILFVLTPVVASRLSLALWPSLLGQGFDLLLLAALARGAAEWPGWRGQLALTALCAGAQASYTGSLINAGVIAALLALTFAATGEARRAGRLLLACGLATLVVVPVQYRHFLPVFFGQVLPHLGHAPPGPVSATPPPAPLFAAERLLIFFGWWLPPLAAWGLWLLRSAPRRVRQVLGVALAAGLLLALLRAAVPTVFSDAKEVELLAGPLALLGALGLRDLVGRRGPWRALGLAGAGGLLVWCLARGADLYRERLVVLLG